MNLSMKEGEYCDSYAPRPVRERGFLLYNIAVYLYCYLDGIRCSWIIEYYVIIDYSISQGKYHHRSTTKWEIISFSFSKGFFSYLHRFLEGL